MPRLVQRDSSPRNEPAYSTRTLPWLAMATLLLALGINLLSAGIRHAESGLGCSPWPQCYATIGAQLEAAPERPSLQHALTPQAWVKQLHRLSASTLVLLALAIAHLGRREARRLGHMAILPWLILATLALLAINGPLSHLKTVPLVATGNLLGGVLLAALCWRLWLQLRPPTLTADRSLHALTRCALLLLCLQITLGAWQSANYAAASCVRLWDCSPATLAHSQGPTAAFAPLRRLQLDATGRIVTDASQLQIHRLHRWSAVLNAALLFGVSILTIRRQPAARASAMTVLALLGTQLLLGAAAVGTALPLPLVLAHNGVATLLLLALMRLQLILAPHHP